MAKDIELVCLNPGVVIPQEIKELYLAAFPEEERRPVADIEARIASGDPHFSFYVIQHKMDILGFATVWTLPGARYIEHFAVLPRHRGKGIGADVIKKLTEAAASDHLPLVLEVELPENGENAARRIEFYKRCGLIAHDDFPYWQPPYARNLPDVPMMLMSSGEIDCETTARLLHLIVYNQ